MTGQEAAEAAAIVARFAAAALGTAPGGSGRTGAELRRACGALTTAAEMRLRAGTLAAAMQEVVDLARQAGAGLVAMGRVRLAMLAEAPSGLSAIAVVQAGVRLALAQESRIVAAATFASRQDIDAAAVRMDAAFEAAALRAADDLDPASYRAIITLRAAVTRHLAEAARPLPRLIDYTLPTARPAPVIAYSAYGDASRAAELIAENKVVHPAFMPRTGRMLANTV